MHEIITISNEITHAAKKIPENTLISLSDIIHSHKRIFIYGTGRSGLMLKAFAMRLMQLGFTTFVVGETITPSIQKNDLLILASASGETESVVQMAQKAKNMGISLAIITSSLNSRLVNIAEPILRINSGTKFSHSEASAQPLGSLFEQMLLIFFDSVIFHISSKLNNDSEIARRHASLE